MKPKENDDEIFVEKPTPYSRRMVFKSIEEKLKDILPEKKDFVVANVAYHANISEKTAMEYLNILINIRKIKFTEDGSIEWSK